MIIGLLILLAPIIVFLISIPFTKWFRPKLRLTYQIAGGLIVFVGSGASTYFAFYGGDQGGIAAYFTQMAVIVTYTAFSILLMLLNMLLRRKRS